MLKAPDWPNEPMLLVRMGARKGVPAAKRELAKRLAAESGKQREG